MVKLVSTMKLVKDLMDNPLPVSEMMQLLQVLKSTGATHIEVATVIGHPNFLTYSEQWADGIHSLGLAVSWRCSHQNMEGLYNQPAYVGTTRKPVQFWIDEAVSAAKALGGIVHSGDEWAIYPERTEGVFQDATSWIDPAGLPNTYAQAFIDIHNACKAVLPTGVVVGLSSNNASELLSGWMPASLPQYAGKVVVDHYRDGDPTTYDTEIRAIHSKYNLPVYVQEGSPDRFTTETRAQDDAYYAVNKKLVEDGVLAGYGSWGGWSGTPESIVDSVNGQFVLNDNGKSLTAWWNPPVVIPQQNIHIATTATKHLFFDVYEHQLTIDGKVVGNLLLTH